MSGLENREYGHRDPSRCPRGTLCSQKLALTSLTSGGRSAGIVRSRSRAMEFLFWRGHTCSVCCSNPRGWSGLLWFSHTISLSSF
jgi:hypothetical protein